MFVTTSIKCFLPKYLNVLYRLLIFLLENALLNISYGLRSDDAKKIYGFYLNK